GATTGARSISKRETLNRDGDEGACAKSTADDRAPPFGCGALLRIEVVPLGEARKADPECPAGTKWDDNQCVATVNKSCPDGMHFEAGKGCAPNVPAARTAQAPVSKPVVAP